MMQLMKAMHALHDLFRSHNMGDCGFEIVIRCDNQLTEDKLRRIIMQDLAPELMWRDPKLPQRLPDESTGWLCRIWGINIETLSRTGRC